MSGARAWVGDWVTDEDRREAIVTDVIRGAVWVLRMPDAVLSDQWTTTDPDSLTVIRRRADRFTTL
ncbi:hypothetical protein MTF65_06790 [Streptomyces sp. APSN-46.1]|uniref:hypothetical protein n=1 Tax=Streptomyces sp. APSN-46.1 TaxID=2929049 RepID=UPI001FB40B08|nr:hypothetical protein [Streptomyces sp. APSN-46.1]MCJ1677055.1 hypothetical protein [Streptomyces sp. APSN-46.1]